MERKKEKMLNHIIVRDLDALCPMSGDLSQIANYLHFLGPWFHKETKILHTYRFTKKSLYFSYVPVLNSPSYLLFPVVIHDWRFSKRNTFREPKKKSTLDASNSAQFPMSQKAGARLIYDFWGEGWVVVIIATSLARTTRRCILDHPHFKIYFLFIVFQPTQQNTE